MVRLRKPLEHFHMKYGTWQYGYQKLYLLMEKQHNRGQEGAGMASIKLDMPPGEEYISRERALGNQAINNLFAAVNKKQSEFDQTRVSDPAFAKQNLPFAGELYMDTYAIVLPEKMVYHMYIHSYAATTGNQKT